MRPQQARACGFFFNQIPLLHQDSRTFFSNVVGDNRGLPQATAYFTPRKLSLTLNLGQCARGWSSAHVSKASYMEAVHALHRHHRPFACEMLRAQVRRVCFRMDLLHRQLVVADRLLEPQVLDLDVLCFAQARSAYHGKCCTGVSVQPNKDDSTQVFGKRLKSHRLCCCTVASLQFCVGGAGGDNALLPRPSLDQVLPVQNLFSADRLS